MSESWDVLSQRIATGRVVINKEASLQLQYSSILLTYGELFCIDPQETFTIELESANARRSIDITCALGDAKAAVELKCFKKQQNRATDTDMYDVLADLERLLSYEDFAVRRFICLTDNPYYATGGHRGLSRSVTIRDGTTYRAGAAITPGWAGRWKSKARDRSITLSKDVQCLWTQNRTWYALVIDI
jgi:hypothetical protein